MKSPSSTSSFCFRFAPGLVCAFLLGLCLCGMVTLHEDMAVSNSPMVMGAPFIMVAFIFAFSWLSYAFFGAATSCERRAEGRLPVCGGGGLRCGLRWRSVAFPGCIFSARFR